MKEGGKWGWEADLSLALSATAPGPGRELGVQPQGEGGKAKTAGFQGKGLTWNHLCLQKGSLGL